MNYEQHLPGAEPRHRGEPRLEAAATDSQSLERVVEIVRQAAGQLAAERLKASGNRHGAPFMAYLGLAGVDVCHPHLAIEFEAAYLGRFPDRAALVAHTIETFGWQRDLQRLLGSHLELTAFVSFDRAAVFGFVSDHFDLVETNDGIYVFEAWQRPRQP